VISKEPYRGILAKASRNLSFGRELNGNWIGNWNLINIIALGSSLEPMKFVKMCIEAGFIDHSQVECKKCPGVGTFELKPLANVTDNSEKSPSRKFRRNAKPSAQKKLSRFSRQICP